MKMKKPIYIIVLFFCLLSAALFTACKPKHKIVYSTTPVEEKANSELFNDIISSSLNYSTFSSRLNLNITSGSKTLSSKAILRIVKRSEEHTSELQSRPHLVCRLLLEKKKKKK